MGQLNDIEIDDYLKDCVTLTPEAINEEYARLSADYAYWNEKYATANKQLLNAEWEEDKLSASLYLEKKEAPEGKKPPTEAAVDAMVKTDPRYEVAHLKVIEYQAEKEHLRGVLEALRTKREMLVSTGATQREEMKGDMRMMDRQSFKRIEREGF